MRETLLHSDWEFNNVTKLPPYARTAVQYQAWLPATVPGHVHLDLHKNGVIGDPFERMNELGSRWIDESDWAYRTSFEWTADAALPNRVLRFEGLDTVCTVSLNGAVIGEFDNMFVPVEIDVSRLLKEGSNELEVTFLSAVRVGDERRSAYFAEEGLSADCKQFDERAFVRKAQYMSAWDWGPRLVSCGIWRPVSLLEFAARVKSFSVLQTKNEDGSVQVKTETEVEGVGEVTLTFGEIEVKSSSGALEEIDVTVSHPIWWWPNGMGEQHLYKASASIAGGNTIAKKIGLRTITLERQPDAIGESFTFLINGKKLWARGANWIPNDSFPSQVTDSDYREQVETCKALGMNMLRVWGGGLYEMDGFYDACDEAGILVWQDFTYACSYYADGEAACEVARIEAETQILRLRDRTSLALWCANNENLTMWQGKWGGAQSPPRYYGENIYDKVLPEALEKLDPQRSYIPTSPIGQESEPGDCNQGRYGDSHYWAVWHGLGDWVYYKDSDTRFSSEFGFASSCSMAQWKQAISKDDWAKDSPAVRWHDKTGKEWEKFYGYVTTHYPAPETLEDWTYSSQINQRDALRFGIEHWRRADYCQGTLIWQFNDCWPVQCWSVQDYLRLLKPAGYELKRLYADHLISLYPVDGKIGLTVVNDGGMDWETSILIEVVSVMDGSLMHSKTLPVHVPSGGRVQVETLETGFAVPALIRAKSEDGVVAWTLDREPKEIEFKEPEFTFEFSGDKLTVTVLGVAVDLVVIDPDNAFNLKPAMADLPGACAVTLVKESAAYGFETKPTRLSLDWLHGRKTVSI
jgi:beta-mannosidase